ncbi:MAG TPA: hypothetical protein VGG33_08185 [Polyangia bacterium]
MNLTKNGHLAETGSAVFIDDDSDEAHLARAERSLEHLNHMLERRRRWRQSLRVLAMIALPVFLTVIVRQARVALA